MKRAFTLIELLVVIAIIAILAAILFPVFAQAKTAAKQTGEISGLKQLGTAFQLYISDYDDVAFPLYYTDPAQPGMPVRWPWLLMPYVKNVDVYFSPADAEGLAFKASRATNPSWDYLFGLSPSWGYNQRLFAPDDQVTGLPVPIPMSNVNLPSDALLLVSSYWGTNATSPRTGYYRVYPPAEWAGSPPLTGLSFGHVWPRFRGTSAGLLYADTHVNVRRIEQLRENKLWTGSE